MRESIMQGDMKGRCYLCGAYCPTEKHHIFGGANRMRSERLGLYVHLCHSCHNEPPNGVHFNATRNNVLRKRAQRAFEERFMYENRCGQDDARTAFMREFGRNYDI